MEQVLDLYIASIKWVITRNLMFEAYFKVLYQFWSYEKSQNFKGDSLFHFAYHWLPLATIY